MFERSSGTRDVRGSKPRGFLLWLRDYCGNAIARGDLSLVSVPPWRYARAASTTYPAATHPNPYTVPTILTVDDHPMIREGLAALLQSEPGFIVVAESENGQDAVEQYRLHRPDLVLMDLRMPVMGGLAATKAILADDPDARIIVLTTYDGDEDIHRALEAGAKGYLLKDMLRKEVVAAVRSVLLGGRGIPASVAVRLAEYTPRVALTPREQEVLELMARGFTNGDIGTAIGRTEGTVKVHVRNILHKLDASDRTEAVTIALQRGFIHLS
jgi:DNA-binding NarL/FixJ family response regulator